MNFRLLFLPALLVSAFLALTGQAQAARNPDFNEDAAPILRIQPQLIDYVHRHFEVKDAGEARVPGDEDHPPQPPFIFMARPRHSDGPFFIRLLVQPGPPGRILKVVDMRTVHLAPPTQAPGNFQTVGAAPEGSEAGEPSSAKLNPAQSQPQPAQAPTAASVPVSSQNAPTADTPSGPIPDPSTPSPATPDHLAPPPDPAP